MSSGAREESSSEDRLNAVIADFEALAAAIDRAIERLAPEEASDQIVATLMNAKAAALRGANLTREMLKSN